MKTLLIVDDHGDFRRQARELLESDGFDVIGEAADGAAALRAVDELQPAIVLLDIGLPDMDGLDVARRLAAAGPAPEVILTSSRDAQTYGRRISASGARGFVPKQELSGAALDAVLGGS